ncbi:MAG: hypothetical protein BHW55_00275 [Candidatus Melainabacteria bacterium 35_41]|nr:MAG: hypothetical protein BHW55_00275 [Candidatus Melainabacteria bacterium 35_41]
MENLERLVKLKCFLQSDEGKYLEDFISNVITELSNTNIDANIIKGMCMLFKAIKDIPEEYENVKQQKENN